MKVEEGFVESGGHRLAYLAVNQHLANDDEPAIVFIHGVLVSVNFWRDCVPASFENGRAWYALSLPAHHPSTTPPGFDLGDVDADWFFDIMDGALRELLGDKKAIVVGHSTGGFCAINLATRQARNVAGIVSIAGFHRGSWGSVEGLLLKLASYGKWAKRAFVSNIQASKTSMLMRRVFASLLAHSPRAYWSNPRSLQMLENVEANTLAQEPSDLFVLFNGLASIDIADQLSQVDVPCYVFYGTDDPVVPEEQALVLASKIPDAKSVVFQNVGHMLFMEDTDACFDALELALDDIAKTEHFDPGARTNRQKTMTYPQYKQDLQRIHESEVYGAAVFRTAARVTRNKKRKQKWLTLLALEEQTLSRYLDYMRESGQTVVDPRGWALRGRGEGTALGLMPWRAAMKLLRDATGPFQEKFRRLRDNASEEDRQFFAYVYAHEKAIESFASKELAGDESSLKAVEGLLGS